MQTSIQDASCCQALFFHRFEKQSMAAGKNFMYAAHVPLHALVMEKNRHEQRTSFGCAAVDFSSLAWFADVRQDVRSIWRPIA